MGIFVNEAKCTVTTRCAYGFVDNDAYEEASYEADISAYEDIAHGFVRGVRGVGGLEIRRLGRVGVMFKNAFLSFVVASTWEIQHILEMHGRDESAKSKCTEQVRRASARSKRTDPI